MGGRRERGKGDGRGEEEKIYESWSFTRDLFRTGVQDDTDHGEKGPV